MEDKEFSLKDDVIDVEWCAKHGLEVPKGRKYRIKVDGKPYEVRDECMTGKEILVLAGKNPPERYQLNMVLHGGKVVKVGLEEKVCFTKPGCEKFTTIPLDQTEGESRKRDFPLSADDHAFMDGLGLQWDAIEAQGGRWVVVYDYPVPSGYTVETVTAAIRMVPGYPAAPLDMVYFSPALARRDGQPINAVSMVNIDGNIYQQWSRHRTGENPWRPGIDDLSTQFMLATWWLEQEFEKRLNHAV
jgi:hypothetical protein